MTDQLKVGGTERQFVALASLLGSDSFRLRLGCLQRTGRFLNEVGEIAEFNSGGSLFSVAAHRARIALARYLRAQDISIAHSFDFYSNLMMIPVARRAGVPVVIGSLRDLGHSIGPLKFAVLSLVLRLCDRVVCNSEAAAARLRGHGLSHSNLVVIPNGVAVDAFAHARPVLPQDSRVLRIGMVARMSNPVKNHVGFLRAAALVSRRFPNAEFVLVGDGSLRGGLEELSRTLGLGSRVVFLGEQTDVAGVMRSLDVSVLPSFSESLSNVILESMAAGKPVVASRVGGNPELVQEGRTGILVSPHDESELAEAICRLLDEPETRKQYGENAAELARQKFSLQCMRQRYTQLYHTLLDEKGRKKRIHDLTKSSRPAETETLRVAIVAPSLRKLGGQSVQADLLLRHWQNDPSVAVTFVPVDPVFPWALRWAERVPFLRTVIRAPIYWARLRRDLRDVHLVHVFSASYWSFLLVTAPACWVAWLMKKKMIVNYHSGEARDHFRRGRAALRVLGRADRIVVPSAYLADVFREFGLCAEVVSNFVDLEQFHFRLRNPLRPRLICTRGFEPYYDVDLVVRAFAEVKKEFPEAELCLVGKGSLEREIRDLVAQLALKDVQFAGWIDRKQIGAFYDQADIFVNASWLDNMPVSVLEGFATGTPVVSTAPEGIRYIVEHGRTGLLCPPKDWRGLAENIRLLLRDPGLARQLARNAFEQSKCYRWEAVRGQWLKVYQDLLAEDGMRVAALEGSPGIAGSPWNPRK